MAHFMISLQESSQKFDVSFGELQYVAPGAEAVYAGSYDVTPKIGEQTLATKKKYMKEDIKINAIPCYDVSNPAGGSTVYIAGELT